MLISPNNYFIQSHERNNIYIHEDTHVSHAPQEHAALVASLHHPKVFTLPKNPKLRDSVFVANAGLSLWGLPHLFILSSMKYAHRREETPYVDTILRSMNIQTFPFPSHVFEGQGETCWFHQGSILFHGYGYRSTLQSCDILQKMLTQIYKSHHKQPPRVIPLKLKSPYFYHLDLAMLKVSETTCVIHEDAFSDKSVQVIRNLLGKDNVHLLHTKNKMVLNSVVQGKTLITQQISPSLQKKLEDITGLTVKPLHIRSFEKSGGGIQCMILNIHTGTYKN